MQASQTALVNSVFRPLHASTMACSRPCHDCPCLYHPSSATEGVYIHPCIHPCICSPEPEQSTAALQATDILTMPLGDAHSKPQEKLLSKWALESWPRWSRPRMQHHMLAGPPPTPSMLTCTTAPR
jgi:hypothetical protein